MVHQRDVSRALLRSKCASPSEFQWMRHYFAPKEELMKQLEVSGVDLEVRSRREAVTWRRARVVRGVRDGMACCSMRSGWQSLP